MAIRFACPACHQPLEIDDAWSGQSVACPYCRRVVTAPQSNTWPGGEVPMASPARTEDAAPSSPAFAPPPPPPGFGPQPAYAPPRTSSAGWALTLAILGALAMVALTLAWLVAMFKMASDKAGPNATQAELQQIAQEMSAKGDFPRSQGLAVMGAAAMLASIGGLAMGVRSLARQEPRRGVAIAACIVGALFLFCQALFMMTLLAPRGGT